MLPSAKQIFLLLSFCYLTINYSTIVSIDTTSSTTFTNFNTDLGVCSCDVSTACDTFCCCDTKCAPDVTAVWTNSGWCAESATEIQKMCDKIGVKGFATFQDLGCIMFSNRGAIGQFYSTPDANNFVDPNIKKFSTYTMNAQGINQYDPLPSSGTYQQGSAVRIILGGTTPSPLYAWLPSVGQSCRQSYIPLTEGVNSYSCSYQILSADHCTNINLGIVGDLCRLGDCSVPITPSPGPGSIAAPIYSGGTCSGAIIQTDISIKIDYTNGQYRITSASISASTGSITGTKATIKTTISISRDVAVAQTSGNPGYSTGKLLKFASGNIFQIADANNNCITNASPSTTSLGIKFGVNQTFTCFSSNPCATPLYIDQIPLASSYSLLKYASRSTDQVSLSGLSSRACGLQSFTLYITYTYSGWILDPQYYILGGTVSGESSANSNSQIKQLNIKWIKVQPSQVYSPPTNYFYLYLQKLWLPLKSKFFKAA